MVILSFPVFEMPSKQRYFVFIDWFKPKWNGNNDESRYYCNWIFINITYKHQSGSVLGIAWKQ